jgi:hypothetical protein
MLVISVTEVVFQSDFCDLGAIGVVGGECIDCDELAGAGHSGQAEQQGQES